MHVDEVVEAVDDAVHQRVRVRLCRRAILLARHEPVQVRAVEVAPLRAQVARRVRDGDGHDGPAHGRAVQLAEEPVDERDTVELVAVQARSDAEHGADALALGGRGKI